MEEKNKPGETVPEPGESERMSAERKAALQDIDRKREEKEKLRQTQKQEAVKVHGSLSAYMNWPLLVCIALLILSIIITMIDWMAGVAASACSIVLIIGLTSVRLNFFPAKHFQRFIFGRGSKSKIAGIFCKLFAIDQGVDLIFQKIVIVVLASGQNDIHFCGKVAILA